MSLVTLAACVLLFACTDSGRGDQSYQNFLKAAKQAPSDGYTMYWLGRQFDAGGVTFAGPSVDDFGQEVDGGGILMSYTAQGPDRYDIRLTVETQSAWADAKSRGIFRIPGNARTRDVTIGGHMGELLVRPAPPGLQGIQGIQLHLDLGDTSLLATVSTYVPAGGGPDPNPLKNEDTFLSAMQNLRPYPQ